MWDAAEVGVVLPKTANTFGRLLTEMKSAIETELNVQLIERRGHAGKRFITLKPKTPRSYPNHKPPKF